MPRGAVMKEAIDFIKTVISWFKKKSDGHLADQPHISKNYDSLICLELIFIQKVDSIRFNMIAALDQCNIRSLLYDFWDQEKNWVM